MMQPSLFEMQEVPVTGRSEPPKTGSPAGAESSDMQGSSAREAVSPLANFPLREICAVCDRDVGAEGRIIPDFEELGAFCRQDCADRGFRLYLEEEPDANEDVLADGPAIDRDVVVISDVVDLDGAERKSDEPHCNLRTFYSARSESTVRKPEALSDGGCQMPQFVPGQSIRQRPPGTLIHDKRFAAVPHATEGF